MATKKVTSAPKKAEVKEEEIKKVPAKEEAVKTTSAKKVFNQDDYITCRSVTVGTLWCEGPKSHTTYNWVDYGDLNDLEYRDLVALVRSRSKFIFGPLFIVEDEDFIEEFSQLRKFYDEQYTVNDLKEVLDLKTTDMIETIKTLPKSAIDSLKSIASTQVANGQLDSVKKIKALDELFGTELNLLSSLMK